MRFLIRVIVNAFAIWIVTLIPALQVSVIAFAPGETLQLVLTLLLVAPAAAVLTSRLRGLLELDRLGAACTGTDLLGPLLLQGLPVVVLLIAIPAALLSLAHRATGWTWLLLVLGVTALLEVGLRVWLPQCA